MTSNLHDAVSEINYDAKDPTHEMVALHVKDVYVLWDRRQIVLIILNQIKRTKKLLLPLKSSKNKQFSDDICGNKS